MEKSANQQWKESDTELSFKEWLKFKQDQGELEIEEYQEPNQHDKTRIFGIDKRWVIGGVLLAAGVAMYFHLKSKNN